MTAYFYDDGKFNREEVERYLAHLENRSGDIPQDVVVAFWVGDEPAIMGELWAAIERGDFVVINPRSHMSRRTTTRTRAGRINLKELQTLARQRQRIVLNERSEVG